MAPGVLETLRRRWRHWRQPAQCQVQIHGPGLPSRTVTIQSGAYRIGRDADGQIPIEHTAVSRQHALLEQRSGAWLLSDNGSTNGLWWRNRRIQQLLLSDGDTVRFGPTHQPGLPELEFQRRPQPRSQRLLRGLALGLAAVASGGLALLALSVAQGPIRGSLATVRGPLALYDRQGKPINSVQGLEHRELAKLGDYPPVLVDALLASEDARFWWHPGVDPVGTARALVTNLAGGRVLEGGSTLTQQLARSLYPDQVGQGETLGRKWRELLVALQLEVLFSKHDLLLSYLNRVYLGVGWGFEDASRHFFGKPAAELELQEAALLVGLLPSPNGYDPCVAPQAALESRNAVLRKMVDSGRLGADAGRSARRSPVQVAPQACKRAAERRGAPFYTDQVRRDLQNLVGPSVAAEGNFLVETHLDPGVQQQVERVLRQRLSSSRGLNVTEGAVVVIDVRNGGIVAIAGGRDYQQSQYNRASMAQRSQGSTFKLFPYLAALERGAGPGDGVNCGPLRWRGQTFSSDCSGKLSLLSAFARSSNTAALRTAQKVGLEAVVQQARDLGVTSSLNAAPGLALGQSEVTLLELTSAYGAVANDGTWHAPSTIKRLVDAETCRGKDPASCRREAAETPAYTAAGRRVVSEKTARSMQQLLRAVVTSGTGRAARLGGREGGKTGTSNENRDLVFIGIAPERHWAVGVWLGNDDNSPTRGSSALAAGLWAEILRATS